MTRWRLTGAQWATLSADLGLATFPPPIRITTRIRGDAAASRVRGELERAGLVRSGRVDADLEAALRQLHRPTVWLDSLWLADPAHDDPARLVAGHGGGAIGVCAVQHPGQDGATTLEIIPAGALVVAVVAALPPQRAGRMPAATVPLERREVQDSGGVLVSGSSARPHQPNGHSAAATILDAAHSRAGQIAASVRDRAGTVRRSSLLRWYDNEADGRYQAALAPRGGALDVGPTDAQRLGATTQLLLASLTGDR